jgi:hypothetical protein
MLNRIMNYLFPVRDDDGLPVVVRGGREMMTHDMKTGTVTPTRETDSGKLFQQIAKGICPDCNKKQDFYEGPSGGLSTNIKCAEGHRFNVTPMVGIADRI